MSMIYTHNRIHSLTGDIYNVNIHTLYLRKKQALSFELYKSYC